ncbi:hypothetical protein [Comamonas endophytica]|uniref:hypothetical protein n=1 Tax=Comamonas endophytica TaxID=2949090 RepID=UPI001E299606|nr:hypothetical protein [Acidovorax sp. D4N7]MCD2514342.1 hypothetical protein [Acidovorax sp. D4N7]
MMHSLAYRCRIPDLSCLARRPEFIQRFHGQDTLAYWKSHPLRDFFLFIGIFRKGFFEILRGVPISSSLAALLLAWQTARMGSMEFFRIDGMKNNTRTHAANGAPYLPAYHIGIRPLE